MECNILFMGPVGSGKTRAIHSISDIETLDTDVRATDETALIKANTTVAMDVGTLHLGGGDKLRLLGAPGQERFDFMWDILVPQAQGVIVMVNHMAPDPFADLNQYLDAVEERAAGRQLPSVVCVTHTESEARSPIPLYTQHMQQRGRSEIADLLPPVMEIDARESRHVRAALVTMVALMEVHERFPRLRHAA